MISLDTGDSQGDAYGPLIAFPCDIVESDKIELRRVGRVQTRDAVVALMTTEGADVAAVNLKPANARRLAAELLNLADECDGTVPLHFVPPGR